MNFCQDCGNKISPLNSARSGCGGRGSLCACLECDIVYEQVSGGILPSPGGETWSKFPWSFSKYRKYLIKNITVFQNNDNQKWHYWDEFFDSKGPFDSKELAEASLAAHYIEHSAEPCCLCAQPTLESDLCNVCHYCNSCGCFEACTAEIENRK